MTKCIGIDWKNLLRVLYASAAIKVISKEKGYRLRVLAPTARGRLGCGNTQPFLHKSAVFFT